MPGHPAFRAGPTRSRGTVARTLDAYIPLRFSGALLLFYDCASRMRRFAPLAPVLLLFACGGHAAAPVAPAALQLPDSTVVLDATTGAPIGTSELLRRIGAADIVLLGEIHDNAVHHEVRGALLTASAASHPAVVFEQFARTSAPIPPPAAGADEAAWLDQYGFDRKNWKWPLHAPVVHAAITSGRSLWGSGLSREALRSVVRQGTGAAPAELARLIEQVPLDSVATAGIDKELFEGHCGKLPENLVPGMRAAQEVRDASMTEALIQAGASGSAWLIAGDGHVRMDMGVPRILRKVAPLKKLLVIGFVERGTDEAVPGKPAGEKYQLLVVTPPATREDPCASL
jgi:uncharacterized iron-regulated protein